jgi:penicillin G amidase
VGGLPITDPELVPLLDLLRQWDGSLQPDSAPAAIYEVLHRELLSMLLTSRLDEFILKPLDNEEGVSAERFHLSEFYRGKGPTPLLMESSLMGMRALEWLLALLEQEESPWYDLGGGQGRTAVVRAALADTLAYLRVELGPRPEDWAWGRLHQLRLTHALGSLEALAPFLNRGPFPLGGDHNTVWAAGTYLHQVKGDQVVGPPFRMIVDLGNLANSRAILMPGQSGRPATDHYADQIGDWYAGSYHPMDFPQAPPLEGEARLLYLDPKEGNGAGTT